MKTFGGDKFEVKYRKGEPACRRIINPSVSVT